MPANHFEGIIRSVASFRKRIDDVGNARRKIDAPRPLPQNMFPSLFRHSVMPYRELLLAVKQMNALPPPKADRDTLIGQTLMPMVILGIKDRRPLDEPAKNLLKLYALTHSGKIALPQWFKDINPFIEVAGITAGMPNGSEFLRRKPLPSPENMPEYTQNVHTVFWPKQEILASYSALMEGLNAVLSACLLSAQGPRTIELPFLDPQLHLEKEAVVVSDIGSFSRSEALVELIGFYRVLRALHSDSLELFSLVPSAAPNRRQIVTSTASSLDHFFDRDRAVAKGCFERLCSFSDPRLTRAAFDLLSTRVPSYGLDGSVSWATAFDNPDNVQFSQWAYKLCLFSEPAQFTEYQKALDSSPQFKASALPMITSARDFILGNDFTGLAGYLRDQIERLSSDATPAAVPDQISILILLYLIGQNPRMSHLVKNRIYNLRKITGILDAITSQGRSISSSSVADLKALAVQISRTLGVTLDDYFGFDEIKSELRELIGDYLYFFKHPEHLEGHEPTAVMENGIFICGEPGVGKTFLVSCAASEFGLPLVSINFAELLKTPARNLQRRFYGDRAAEILDEKQREAEKGLNPKLAFIKRKIAEAVALSQKGPVVLFIDEFERVSAARRSAKETEVSQLTADMLEEIERIRLEHPGILLVVATNYEDMVDLAMLRDGRFDTILKHEPPKDDDREKIIRKTLEIEASYGGISQNDLNIPQDMMAKFVSASDGLLPLSIKKAVILYIRLLPKEKAQFTCEGLLKALEEKAKRRKYYIERSKAERNGRNSFD